MNFRNFVLVFCLILHSFTLYSQTKLGNDIDGEAANDGSGYSVSISQDGSRVAIGAHNNDGNGSNSGYVRVYDWNGSNWVQLGIDINGEAANDFSGFSVFDLIGLVILFFLFIIL